jgi:hypothetical protein
MIIHPREKFLFVHGTRRSYPMAKNTEQAGSSLAELIVDEEETRLERSGVTRRAFLSGGTAVVAGVMASGLGWQAVTAFAHNSNASASPQAPVLLHVSDAVKPGDLFSLQGEWLDAASVEVVVAAAAGADGATPPAHAEKATIVQTDEQGHFVVARVPQQLKPGAYRAWVRNASGYSNPLPVNQPRPLFLSEREAWAGQQIQIVGRNFDPKEFGAKGKPRVRLVDSEGERTQAQIVNSNPYALTITVPEVGTGTYKLEVSTQGSHWWALPTEETITVVGVGQDPLGLGVAWADHFHWERVFNVAEQGVPTTGGVDVTTQVQAVVDAAKAAGGGVVYFPAGTYEISHIALPADIVLQGAGADKTTLLSTAVGGNFINTSGDGQTRGHQGVARLRLELKNPDVRPDAFIWLGEPWAQNNNVQDLTTRTASEVFVKNVDLTYSLLPPPVTAGQRGIGLEWIVKERALCTDSHFVGYHAQPYINYITHYYTVKRNHFEYATGVVVCNGSHCFYEDNQVIGHREHTATRDADLHGLFARDRAYMANNLVRGMGTLPGGLGSLANDGEALCVEVPNANFNYGSVTAATPTTITVSPDVPLTMPLIYFGYLAVAIVDGRGLGQWRRVSNVDSANNQLTIEQPWDVTPDATSAFSLLLPLAQVTFYHNTISDCAKGLWLYGNTYDSVQADNTSTDSEGCFIFTVRAAGRLTPGYFARIARNRVVGISPRSKHCGVSYYTGRFDRNGSYFGTMAYGIEFVDNSVSGDPNAIPVVGSTEAPPFPGGLAISAASFSSYYDGNPVGGDGKNTLMARNQLTELAVGVNLTHSLYGTVIAETTYTSTVGTFLDDTGSLNTLQVNNTQV